MPGTGLSLWNRCQSAIHLDEDGIEATPGNPQGGTVDMDEERAMSSTDRLWLNGFTTMSEVLANDRLAIEEVRQVLEEDCVADQQWLAPWKAGLDAGLRACYGG